MKKGYLILEDGSVWEGIRFGSDSQTYGEVVFTTGMVGYPESLTDPSYEGQIIVTTYPLQGNYGIPSKKQVSGIEAFFESGRIHAQAMIVSTYIDHYSHWNTVSSLDTYLRTEKIPGLTGIDTRALTVRLREKGVMLGQLRDIPEAVIPFVDPNITNLVAQASIKKPVHYGTGNKVVLLIDCGVKHGIIFQLLSLGVSVLRVPWNFDISRYKKPFDAVIISNGPGDPTQVKETIAQAQYCLSRDIPTLGVCLGNQIVALAAGGKTYKLPYGHRSHNQPARDQLTKKAYMTTQNHGFAVDMKSLSSEWNEWFINLNDNTNEGIRHRKKLFWSTQFHPEGRPGPFDTAWVFEEFLKEMERTK